MRVTVLKLVGEADAEAAAAAAEVVAKPRAADAEGAEKTPTVVAPVLK